MVHSSPLANINVGFHTNFSSIGQEIKNLRNKWHSVVVNILAVFMVTKNKCVELLGYVRNESVSSQNDFDTPHAHDILQLCD